MPDQSGYSCAAGSMAPGQNRWQFSLASILRGMAICGIVCAVGRWLAEESHGDSWTAYLADAFYPLAMLLFSVALFAAPASFVGLAIAILRRPRGCWTGWIYLGCSAVAMAGLFGAEFSEGQMFRGLDVLALANAGMWMEAWFRHVIGPRGVPLGLATIITVSYGSVVTALAVWASY